MIMSDDFEVRDGDVAIVAVYMPDAVAANDDLRTHGWVPAPGPDASGEAGQAQTAPRAADQSTATR